MPNWHLKDRQSIIFPSGQYVDKKISKRGIPDGKEWGRNGKPLIFFGGGNFRKGNNLRFAGKLIRNAEAVASSPICSTNTPGIRYLAGWSYCPVSQRAILRRFLCEAFWRTF
jgi:hypothetical protein